MQNHGKELQLLLVKAFWELDSEGSKEGALEVREQSNEEFA